ncbi:hypothetical protein THIX_20540 [Thiomonas sp. X19]|nr:hypothetical protein THIX_20540 [Thiomonas sp. X19]
MCKLAIQLRQLSVEPWSEHSWVAAMTGRRERPQEGFWQALRAWRSITMHDKLRRLNRSTRNGRRKTVPFPSTPR